MNVFEAAQQRIEWALTEFDYCYVSFSGGKDSGVMLELTAQIARRMGKRWGIYHMDYEAQYQLTTDYVRETLDRYRNEADIYHVCVPFMVTTCTSMFQSYWRPWEPLKRDIWVRPMPEGAMTAEQFPFWNIDQWDYDFQDRFGQWISERKGRTACLVGIRTQESLNRWRTIHAERENRKNYQGRDYTTDMGGCVAVYPIYDWTVEDVWTANARNRWPYNKLYDMMYLAGVPLSKMRVASPFLSEGQDALRLYQVIEPDTWGKLVGRVNGVNFAGLYGGTTMMGWKSITKPAHFTWKEYMYRRDPPRLSAKARNQHKVLEREGRLPIRRNHRGTAQGGSQYRGAERHELQDHEEARAHGLPRRHRHHPVQGDTNLQAHVHLHH